MSTSRVHHPRGASPVLNQLKRTYGVPGPAPEREPVEQIILAILEHNEPEGAAANSLAKLKSEYVDFNELRVSRTGELTELLGTEISNPRAKARRLLAVLRAVFNKENSFDLSSLKSKSKQDMEEYFKTVGETDNYLASSVLLHCCGRQAFPLDEKMLKACEELQLVEGEVDMAGLQSFLERQVRASQAYSFCRLLKKSSLNEPSKTQKAAKKTTKKKAKKKTVVKSKSRTGKNTAKKKTTKKRTAARKK